MSLSANDINTVPLAGCPQRPNCVSSNAEDLKHTIAPFYLKDDPATGWDAIQIVVASLPRTQITRVSDRYLRAECKSRLLCFIDDLELHLDVASGRVAIRSASRVGYFDWGVNRRRVETLRRKLSKAEVIR